MAGGAAAALAYGRGLAFCALNLAFRHEIWPGTPRAETVLGMGLRLCTLLLLPQLAWCGWRWVRAWRLPRVLRGLASAAYLAGAGIMGGLWLALLAESGWALLRALPRGL